MAPERMIILDYKNIDLSTCNLDYEEKLWTDGIYFGAFFGTQIFVVNNVDLSFDCPILGFARQLKFIALGLLSGQEGSLVDPEFEYPWQLEFAPNGNRFSITEVKWKDRSITRNVAESEVDELVITSTEYLDRVILQCNILCPKLQKSKLVKKWLDDLSLPAFNGFRGS